MAQNPPEGTPQVMPYLYYEDARAALEFLTSAFGLRERFKLDGPDGRVAHAEVEIGDKGVIMFGEPGEGFRSSKARGGQGTASVYVYVDDVDEHHARAQAAGATILREPEDQSYGDRNYAAKDPEGHEWFFATHVRDVTSAEMAQAIGSSAE
jgi:PhnB protein